MSKSANLQVLRTTKKSRSEPSERLLFKLNKKNIYLPQNRNKELFKAVSSYYNHNSCSLLLGSDFKNLYLRYSFLNKREQLHIMQLLQNRYFLSHSPDMVVRR